MEAWLERFHNGTETEAYRYLGCHYADGDDPDMLVFRVWAPRALKVFLSGSFNNWSNYELPMNHIGYGVYEVKTSLPKIGDTYKYCMYASLGRNIWKSDPYGCLCSKMPDTSSIVKPLPDYHWKDGAYRRAKANWKATVNPINIYEVHLASWDKKENGEPYSYRELADTLIPYVKDMGYTHIELLPVSEHPYEPSWGYQTTCYYAPQSRLGNPEDFMYFIDCCHKEKIGVLLDWVPGHFPKDEQGLYEFDGTTCYELSDPLMNEHPQWTTRLFDYGKPEVLSFLVSNAVYWVKEYHLDGIRVDAVASMLYLNFERTEWHPNKYGGNLNLEAIEFLKRMNLAVSNVRANIITAAEESSTFPGVTKPVSEGGLGFTLKWNMGWMNDTLKYAEQDPIYRKYHHNNMTFAMTYAYTENFILPFSHDEVVHGKKSMVNKMPGKYDDKFSNLRAFFGYQMSHPGKKLNFMGNEFGQFIEWNEQRPLDWFLLDYDRHSQMKKWVKELNHFYLENPAMWQDDSDWDGFQWIEPNDGNNSVIAYRRIARNGDEVIAVFNFCPVLREHYRLGLPKKGCYVPVLSSDSRAFGGTDVALQTVRAEPVSSQGYALSAEFTLPPLSVVFYKNE